MSPKDKTAISVVPPPISITIHPFGLAISSPAPTAATLGSSSINTFFAPAASATSLIASFSTSVILVGQQISIVGFEKVFFACTSELSRPSPLQNYSVAPIKYK